MFQSGGNYVLNLLLSNHYHNYYRQLTLSYFSALMARQYTLKGKRKASRSPSPSSDSSHTVSPSPVIGRNCKRSKTFHGMLYIGLYASYPGLISCIEDDFEDDEPVGKESNFDSEHSAPSPGPSRKTSSSMQHSILHKEKATLELIRAVKESASRRTGSQHGAGSRIYTMAEQDVTGKGNLTKKMCSSLLYDYYY